MDYSVNINQANLSIFFRQGSVECIWFDVNSPAVLPKDDPWKQGETEWQSCLSK